MRTISTSGARDLLDNGDTVTAAEQRAALIRSESADITRLLNYFELVAYFRRCGQLSGKDVDALLGYYLDLLNTTAIRGYLAEKSYGELNELLGKMAKRKERA